MAFGTAHAASGIYSYVGDGVIEVHTSGGYPGVTATVSCDVTAAVPSDETDWSLAGSGDWFDASNWSNGVPDNTILVTKIDNGGTATINGGAANAGSGLYLCGETADLQAAGSLTADDILISDGGTMLLSGSDAVSGQITLDGGVLHSDITGTLSNQFQFAEATTSTISVAAGETLTLTGAFPSLGADANIVFGSTSDTGTIIFTPSSVPAPGNASPAGGIEIAGGTLKAGNESLGSLYITSIKVDAGATLDFDDQEPPAGNIITDLLGAGNVVTGSSSTTLLLLGAANFSGTISGAGRLYVAPVCFEASGFCTSGIAELSGTNTFTGNTTIFGGTLLLDSGGAITGTSNVIVDSGGNLTVNGTFTGGGISINAGGEMTVSGSVTTGITVGSGGVFTVDNGGTVNASGGLAVSGTAVIDGSVTSEFAGIEVLSGGDFTVHGSTNTQGFEVRGTGVATIDGSSTSSSGVIVADNDSALIVGSNGSIESPFDVLIAGTLKVDGTVTSTNGLTVYAGGTVTGSGTVASTQVTSGGTIAPGDNGIGTLHVGGNLSIAEGGIYDAEVSANSSDKIAVAGSASLAGTLETTQLSLPIVGVKYTVLTASAGITGRFGDPAPVPLGEYQQIISYDTNDVMLEYELATLSPHLPDGATQNETAVAGDIDNAIDPGTALPDAFQPLGDLSPADLAAAATQLSGEIAADLPQVGATAVDPFLDALLDPSGNHSRYMGAAGRLRRHNGMNAWVAGYGEHSSITGDTSGAGSHSFSGSTIGTAMGLDVRVLPGLIAGAALGYDRSTFSLSDDLGSGTSRDLQFGIHARADMGRHAYFSAGGVYALQDVTTHRAITLPADATLDAKFIAHDLAGRVESGYRMYLSRSTTLTPFAAAQWASFDAPGYDETGSADYALNYDADSTTNSRVELGAAIDEDMRLGYGTSLCLDGRAAFAHAFQTNQDAHAAFASLPGSGFTVQGAAPGSNLALLSLDAEVTGRNGLSLGLKLDGTLSQNSQSYFGTADLNYTF